MSHRIGAKKLALISILALGTLAFQQQVIYGEDDRKNLYEVTDARERLWAEGTVAIFLKSRVIEQGQGWSRLNLGRYGNLLCPNERFFGEPTGPFCSGFLVTPDVVVTAGHCMSICEQIIFVFGYALQSPTDSLEYVSDRDIYYCRKMIYRKIDGNGADFAVVRLDRDVKGHRPLSVRKSGAPSVDMPLTLVGYPQGLPVKVAGGAAIRSIESTYLMTNTDSYKNNSGSPVINSETGEVEGILVRGESDFEPSPDKSCKVSKQCKMNECRGEDATLISEVLPYIPSSAINGK